MACGVDPADSDCLTVDGLSVDGLWEKQMAWWSIGVLSTDMRVDGASIRSLVRISCGRFSKRRRTFLFLIRRSARTDLRNRTRTSMVARSLGLQSSILRSGSRFFRCLCELRCLYQSQHGDAPPGRGEKGGARHARPRFGGLRTSDQTNRL